MTARLVAHSRLALRKAWATGALCDATYREALALMVELGVRDGAQIAYDGDDWISDIQGWLDRMPRRHAEATRRRYARHAVRLYEHLTAEGKTFADVDEALLIGWAENRQRGRGDSTWAQEERALVSLFEWLASPDNPERRYERSPWPLWYSGTHGTSRVRKGPQSLSPQVRMLDDVEWTWFRNVGLAGRDAGPDAFLPRFAERDTALGDLLVTTGIRLNEARCLLIDEVPQPSAAQRRRPWPNTMLFAGGARAKTRGGLVPFLPEVGDRLWDWWESPVRQAIVDAAQPTLRQRSRAGLLFVVDRDGITSAGGKLAFSGQWLGEWRTWTADTLPKEAAERAVYLNGSRVEPLTLWQTDANGGGPMSGTALRQVFAEATVRVAATAGQPFGSDVLHWRRQRDGSRRVTGGVTPHMLRHTAAVNWLVELNREVQRRARGGELVLHHHLPSGGLFDPMHYVRTWLRHVGMRTTWQYQTWAHREQWADGHALGTGVHDLIVDRQVGR